MWIKQMKLKPIDIVLLEETRDVVNAKLEMWMEAL